MPYHWTDTPQGPEVLRLRAYNSLSPKGFALMIGITSLMLALPLMSVLGTALLWWMLPFLIAAVAALWIALRRSYRDRQVFELLTRKGDTLTLIHQPARAAAIEWSCNIYWVRVELHKSGGPVDYYVTLTGNGRTVEIGRFLAEEERQMLFEELTEYLQSEIAAPPRG
ncbi:Uncharacterized membrane protein [Cognatishimia maritima]|uniref:Uncharacterized membrane protein n=2 Tax=Cognatishimia maritima TaxID=870908 RepID=A0A1M5TSB8_9RHOB|nr:Uncharacterized membrane protein [Cognatishimia maritima]